MKRKFEVSYYECGLTKRKHRVFRNELLAYLYKGYMEYLLQEFGKVEIKKL